MEELTRYVPFRISEEEYARLKKLSKERNYKNFSAFIRDSLLENNGMYSKAVRRQMSDLQWEINKIGTNINQATRKINSGYGAYVDVREIMDAQAKLATLMEKYLEEVEQGWQSQN